MGWLNVLKYHHDNGKDLPVNLRYCFEGMEENGSQGLDEKIKKEAEEGGWFHGVDAVCIVSRLSVLFIPLVPLTHFPAHIVRQLLAGKGSSRVDKWSSWYSFL